MNKQYDSFDNVNFLTQIILHHLQDKIIIMIDYITYILNLCVKKNEGMPPIEKKERVKPIENIEIDYYELYGFSKSKNRC